MAIRVEIPAFLLMFTVMISETVLTNQIVYLTCYVTLGYDQSQCALLGSGNHSKEIADLEKSVQPYASTFRMITGLFGTVLNSIVCLLLVSWSDKYGRRLVLLSSLTGHLLSFLSLTVFSIIPYISPWFMMLFNVFSLFGSITAFLSCCFSYVSDVSLEENRATRLGLFEASISLGMLLGSMSCSYIFYGTNYVTVYLICALCILVGLLFTVFCIPESLTSINPRGNIRDVFSINHVKDMVKTITRQRENYGRTILLLLILALIFSSFITNESSMLFLFVRGKFQWSLRKYTLFTTCTSVIGMVGTVFSTYVLNKVLKIPETVLMLVGLLSMLDGSLLYALASTDWHMYAGGAVRFLGGGVATMSQSIMTKIVSPDEIGKIFSLFITLDTLCISLSSPLYTFVYNSTLDYNPGAVFFISASCIILEIFLTIAIIWCRNRQFFYQHGQILQENPDD